MAKHRYGSASWQPFGPPGTIVPWPLGGPWVGVVQANGRSLRRFKGKVDTRARQINRWLAQGRNPDDGSPTHKAKRRPKKNWVKKAFSKNKGALHRYLRIPEGQKIPVAKLRKCVRKGGKWAKRAQLVLNMRSARLRRLGKLR